MVHLAPLTYAWPTDLLVVALILVVKMRANVYDLFHTQYNIIIMNACAYVWCSCNALVLGAYVIMAWQLTYSITSCMNKKMYGKRDPFMQTIYSILLASKYILLTSFASFTLAPPSNKVLTSSMLPAKLARNSGVEPVCVGGGVGVV